MRRLRSGLPVWLDRPGRKPTFPRHRGTIDADVVIIGGGITGAICAYLFARAGVDVVLLEAKDIARGSTAASTALLMQEPDRDFADLSRRFGPAATREIWRTLARATRDLTRTIHRLRLKVDLCECGSVYYTLDPRHVSKLRKEFRARRAAGVAGRWLSPEDVARVAGFSAAAAIFTPHNAQIDPIRACRGFLDAAARRGARIFERSRVRGVKTSTSGVEVRTSGGMVSAACVIVATGYATPEFRGLVGRFKMKDTYAIATRRLPVRLRQVMFGAAHSRSGTSMPPMAWDTNRPYHYLRWTGDGRLLMGGEDTEHRSARGSRRRIARARARLLTYLARLYPRLGCERPAYAWEGLFAETPDGLPYVGRHSRYPKHLFALGYGGNGMTASFLAAQVLLDLYQGRDKIRAVRSRANLFAFRRGRR